MNKVTVTTTSGYTWTTNINGTLDEVTGYFLGNYFPVGSFDETKPNEGFKSELVTKVVYNDTYTTTYDL